MFLMPALGWAVEDTRHQLIFTCSPTNEYTPGSGRSFKILRLCAGSQSALLQLGVQGRNSTAQGFLNS